MPSPDRCRCGVKLPPGEGGGDGGDIAAAQCMVATVCCASCDDLECEPFAKENSVVLIPTPTFIYYGAGVSGRCVSVGRPSASEGGSRGASHVQSFSACGLWLRS